MPPPTKRDKTWRIIFNPIELRIVYYCNDVKVLDVLLSDVCSWGEWRVHAEKLFKVIVFRPNHDSASNEYCLGSLGM